MIDPIGDRDALVSALRLIASEPVMNDRSRAIRIGGLGSTPDHLGPTCRDPKRPKRPRRKLRTND